jgi:hypothetical protein
MTAESSYKNYRDMLANTTSACIPYIGVYLIDLTYMEDGNPDKINDRINMVKRDMISKVIQRIQSQQESSNAGEKFSEELMQLLWNIPEASNEYVKKLIHVDMRIFCGMRARKESSAIKTVEIYLFLFCVHFKRFMQ